MRILWHALLERIWPSRIFPSDGNARRMVLLQAAIAMAIALAAGPEVIAAMEMTTLLEMLGASLFLTAYFTGAKLTAISIGRGMCEIMLPAAQVSVIRADISWREKAPALLYVGLNAAWLLAFAAVAGAWVKHVIPLVA